MEKETNNINGGMYEKKYVLKKGSAGFSVN